MPCGIRQVPITSVVVSVAVRWLGLVTGGGQRPVYNSRREASRAKRVSVCRSGKGVSVYGSCSG